MPVSFQIKSSCNLVISRFSGHIHWQDCITAAKAFTADPTASPAQNHIYDMRGLTGFDRDYVTFLQMMVDLPDDLFRPPDTRLIVYIAPDRVAQELCNMILRSMSAVTGPVARIVETEAQAAEVLGLRQAQLADLLAGDV